MGETVVVDGLGDVDVYTKIIATLDFALIVLPWWASFVRVRPDRFFCAKIVDCHGAGKDTPRLHREPGVLRGGQAAICSLGSLIDVDMWWVGRLEICSVCADIFFTSFSSGLNAKGGTSCSTRNWF
ncbi:hypothetical protein KXJ81_16955 [Ensifer adhaerens]|nr:hypothetical protein [Ensifer adhaerens]